MYLCIYSSMYLCIYVSMYLCTYVWLRMYVCTCMYVRTYIYMCACIYDSIQLHHITIYIWHEVQVSAADSSHSCNPSCNPSISELWSHVILWPSTWASWALTQDSRQIQHALRFRRRLLSLEKLPRQRPDFGSAELRTSGWIQQLFLKFGCKTRPVPWCSLMFLAHLTILRSVSRISDNVRPNLNSSLSFKKST